MNLKELIVKIAECEKERHYKEMYYYLCKAFRIDSNNYELFLFLGDYYLQVMKNPNQALLCYENALYYCKKAIKLSAGTSGELMDDHEVVVTYINNLKENYDITLKDFSIIIVSYNAYDQMIQCIESIRENVSLLDVEVIVVDNGSSDGIDEWLFKQKDIKVYCSPTNLGFGAGSNKGVELAKEGNDIFFLNNDTIVTSNSIFWLRMALYQDEKIAACGPYSNYYGNDQTLKNQYNNIEDYLDYVTSKVNLLPMPYDNRDGEEIYSDYGLLGNDRIWLSGFAMFCRRSVLDEIGLFDLDYERGYFEDNDLSIRMLNNRYKLLACPNSIIYHHGSTGFGKNMQYTMQLLEKNRQIFKNKWSGIDLNDFSIPAFNIVDKISADCEIFEEISVLDLNCKAGVTLAKIKEIFPKADLFGCARNKFFEKIDMKRLTLCQYDMLMEIDKRIFDYVICEDIDSFCNENADGDNKLFEYMQTVSKIVLSAFIFTISSYYSPEIIQKYLLLVGMDIEVINKIIGQDKYIVKSVRRK